MTRAERVRYGKLADMGCVLCHHLGTPGTPAEIHHLRDGQGMSQRAPNDQTIGLCTYHHRGPEGYHGMGKRRFEAVYGVTERDLLAKADRLIGVAA